MLENEWESEEAAAASGASSAELLRRYGTSAAFAEYDHQSSSWRTFQGSLFGGWDEFSGTWPNSGMTRGGRAFVLPTPALPTVESASSSSASTWPTPQATDEKIDRRSNEAVLRDAQRPSAGSSLVYAVRAPKEHWPTPAAGNFNDSESPESFYARAATRKAAKRDNGNGNGTPLSIAAKEDWPTPIAEDAESRTSNGTLLDAVRSRDWPTPVAMDAAGFEGKPDVGRTSPNSGNTLTGAAAKEWQTPMASSNRKSRKAMTASTENGRRSGGGNSSPPGLEQQVELAEGLWPPEMPPIEQLPPETRSMVEETWQTPQSRDWKGVSQSFHEGDVGGLPDQIAGLPAEEPGNTSGSRPVVLNPRWVAALMGFPVDWLDGVEPPSRPSGTPSSRTSQKSSPDE